MKFFYFGESYMKTLKKLCVALFILSLLTACGESPSESESHLPPVSGETETIESEDIVDEKTIFDLLGSENGFTKLYDAKENDSKNLESTTLGACAILVNSFSSARLGTESAKASIGLLVPNHIYDNLSSPNEKLDAIYNYADKTLSSYFSLYVDDGEVYDAEINLSNIRIFVEDCISTGVFTGDSSNWTLVEGLTLSQFSDKMNITKEVAFTMLYTLELYDASWITGDSASILDAMLENETVTKVSAESD